MMNIQKKRHFPWVFFSRNLLRCLEKKLNYYNICHILSLIYSILSFKMFWCRNWHSIVINYMLIKISKNEMVFLFCFCIFGATPMVYGGSQARGQIRATAASLHHSHSHARSELRLRPKPQLMAMPDPQPTDRGQGANLCHTCSAHHSSDTTGFLPAEGWGNTPHDCSFTSKGRPEAGVPRGCSSLCEPWTSCDCFHSFPWCLLSLRSFLSFPCLFSTSWTKWMNTWARPPLDYPPCHCWGTSWDCSRRGSISSPKHLFCLLY